MQINSKAAQKNKKKHVNPHLKDIKRNFLHAFLWKIGYYHDKKEHVHCPKDFRYPIESKTIDSKEPTALWINHCTFCLKTKDFTLLTDPIFSEVCSPLSFAGPKRQHPPGISLFDLPLIDMVMISHNHYDHLDKNSVLGLHILFPEIQWVVPLGLKPWFEKLGIFRVEEFGWWEEKTFSSLHDDLIVKITAVPAQHYSGRTPFDFRKTLWCGFVGEITHTNETKKFYFSGDTGYNEHDFKAVGDKWKGMDLSLLPIGAYMPRKFMYPMHVSPEESVVIHKEIHSKLSIAMHWKTFDLADEKLYQPPYELFLELQRQKIDLQEFLVVEPGTYVNW
jgi:N-acyl-phosphatidylethanolamine-hydrolysing phospholipase D